MCKARPSGAPINFRIALLPILATTAFNVSAQTLDVTFAENFIVSAAFHNAPRTYLEFLHNSALGNPTEPVTLYGVEFRLSLSVNDGIPATWPSQDLTFANYTIQLAAPSTKMLTDREFVSSSALFADYMSDPVVVYNDAYTIPTGAYANTGESNPFGPTLIFSTPYVFDPSNQGLMLYLSHSGYDPSTEPQPYFAAAFYLSGQQDALLSTAGAGQLQGNYSGNAYIVRFITAPIPEPGSGVLMMLSAASLLRRRR